MDLGFETCGNATLIAYDRGLPILTTDPWIEGAQYFGSWTLPYAFTEQQLEAFAKVRHVWISHGHPDHLNLDSLPLFRDKTILLPTHRGDRIASDLQHAGYDVRVVPNAEWLQLSDRIRIFCIGDWNQDAAVLVALGDRCGILNLNDGTALGNRDRFARELRRFARRFVLRLINYGDADMMNFYTESGERVMPIAAERKPLGMSYAALLRQWNGTHTAPFSCFHAYARTDSEWAAAVETPLDAHTVGFDPRRGELLPGYFSYDAVSDRADVRPHVRTPRKFRAPAEFGDDWDEPLEKADVQMLSAYFLRFEHLKRHFEFVNFRVGAADNVISLGGPRGRGITFEVPRNSLMTAVKLEIFDDLLIGNFMKTTLHGGVRSLYPDFTPYVAKYGDNGRAFSEAELEDYFSAYRSAGFRAWAEQMIAQSSRRLRQQGLALLARNRSVYLTARRLYGHLKA